MAGSEGNTSLPPVRYGVLGEERVLQVKKRKRIAMVGMGLTCIQFVQDQFGFGGWKKNPDDEIWAIGPAAYAFRADMCWEMHSLNNIQRVWKKEYMEGHGENYLKNLDMPVIMPRAYSEIPTSLEYPLQEVVSYTQETYFMHTFAYMLAYAETCETEELWFYGVDFNYAGTNLTAELRRACAEYWMGRLRVKGCKLYFPPQSSLLEIAERRSNGIYGYEEHQPMFDTSHRITQFVSVEKIKHEAVAIEAIKAHLGQKLEDRDPREVMATICNTMQISPEVLTAHLEKLHAK